MTSHMGDHGSGIDYLKAEVLSFCKRLTTSMFERKRYSCRRIMRFDFHVTHLRSDKPC